MAIYKTAISKPITTGLIFVAVIVLGLFSLSRLPIDQMPEMDPPYVTVMTTYAGANASEIETNITKLIENSLNSVDGLKNITSTSKDNISVVTLEFEWGSNIDEALNDIRSYVDLLYDNLPDGVSRPMILKLNSSAMPIMVYGFTAKESYSGLDRILEDNVVNELNRVDGIGNITVSGAPERYIYIDLDPKQLDAYGLSLEQVGTAISSNNLDLASGTVKMGKEQYQMRVKGEYIESSEIADIAVALTPTGKQVFVRDLATVRDTIKDLSLDEKINRQDGARLIITKQTGANTVAIAREVKAEMENIKKTLPPDIQMTLVRDASEEIVNAINGLTESIFYALLFVILVVLVFLGNWRSTIIIALTIPISLVTSFIYLLLADSSLNIISLASLTVAIGMVVDDAIVVLENITTHIERGSKPKEAAVHATQEVQLSVIASTLTMLAVFLPLTMIKGTTGVMFKQLGWIVSIIMIVSTTGALTLVPMMCSKMLVMNPHQSNFHKAIFRPINKGLDAISNGYARLINWCLGHRKVIIFSMLGLFILSIVFLAPTLKTEMMPKLDEGRLSINIELPTGTGQDITGAFAKSLAEDFMQIPEVKICNYSFGQADSDNAFASMRSNGTHIMSFNLRLGTKTERRKAGLRKTSEVADEIRAKLNAMPEIKKANVNEGGGGMGGMSTVQVEVYGYDFTTTDNVANDIAQKLRDRGILQVIVSRDAYTPEYQVDFDREKLALNGLNSTTAATYVKNRINGSVGSYYREDGEEYDIRVRYAPEFRKSVEDIEDIKIYNSYGQPVRVGDLGEVVESLTPPQIQRKDRERMVSVTAVVGKGMVLSDVVKICQEVIDDTEIPAEIMTKIAGDYETQQEMFGDLLTLLVLIIILVYIVMASQFENLMKPFVIMFSVPFTFTGVLLGLWATNTALGAMAFVGVLILMGIVVKNGIVLIDYTTLLEERGVEVKEATVRAARSRLRPILMTTLTTVLGMIPLAIGRGEGAEMWNSLGITVAWGLTISTLITLLLIPALYCSLETRAVRRKRRKAEEALTKTENIR